MTTATSHNDQLKLRIQNNPERFAKEMLEGGSYGWNKNLWPLFTTVSEFIAVITMMASHAPSNFIARIPHIVAYLARLKLNQLYNNLDHNFLPENTADAWHVGKRHFHLIEQIFDGAMRTLGKDERIHPHVIRLLPINYRLDALFFCKRIDEGVEMSIQLLLFELEEDDPRVPEILSKLTSRMMADNAPYIYAHALTAGFDKTDGEFGYWKTTTTKVGRQHMGQRGDLYSQSTPEVTKVPRHTRVRDAWFYQALRNRVTECGWAFKKPVLHRQADRIDDIRTESSVWTTFPMPILNNVIFMTYFASRFDVIVPASRVWDPNDVETRVSGEAIIFEMPPIFDAPYHLDRVDSDWEKFREWKKTAPRARRR